jgi:hypothetical protein
VIEAEVGQKGLKTMPDTMVVSEEQAYELLAHLVASAELCIREPHYYGTFRLIDADGFHAGERLGGFQHRP